MRSYEGSFQSLLQEIEKGRRGEGVWIPLRYPSLTHEVGISKRLYHLFGGDPGSGKTSFADQTYVLDAHNWVKKNDTHIKIKTLYFSMERSQVHKKAKWLAYRMWRENGVLLSVNDILSWGTAKKEITDQIKAVMETHEEYFDELFQNVHVIDGKLNPTGIWKALNKFALEHGTTYGRDPEGRYYKITLDSWNNSNPDQRAIPITKEECPVDLKRKYDKQYVPNDPNLILQGVIDHFGKVKSEEGLNEKQTIDRTSDYLSAWRDLFGGSVVGIQQFNRNNANIQRRINVDLTPEPQDFKGSANPFEDADIVFGLINPVKHGLTSYKGFNIAKTKQNKYSRFRSVTLLKNSYGADNLIAAFRFIGECGAFDQITGDPKNLNYEQTFQIT